MAFNSHNIHSDIDPSCVQPKEGTVTCLLEIMTRTTPSGLIISFVLGSSITKSFKQYATFAWRF